jgi:hypothetical protein
MEWWNKLERNQPQRTQRSQSRGGFQTRPYNFAFYAFFVVNFIFNPAPPRWRKRGARADIFMVGGF